MREAPRMLSKRVSQMDESTEHGGVSGSPVKCTAKMRVFGKPPNKYFIRYRLVHTVARAPFTVSIANTINFSTAHPLECERKLKLFGKVHTKTRPEEGAMLLQLCMAKNRSGYFPQYCHRPGVFRGHSNSLCCMHVSSTRKRRHTSSPLTTHSINDRVV